MSTHWPLSSLMHRVGDTSGIESGIELKRGKLYDRQPTGRAPLEIFSVVLIISSRICPWKRRFEQRSEEERDADQRRNDKTPNSRLMETVASLLSSLSRDGGRRTTRIAHKEMGVLVPKQRSWLRRRRRTSRLALSFSARVELVVPVSVEDWDNWRVLSLVVGCPELVGRSLERPVLLGELARSR